MAEETENDGTWGGLKKTIVGTLATVVTGGGVWISTTLFGGGGNDSEETKTEQAAPAVAPVFNLNLENNNQSNASAGGGGGTTVIREKETIREVAPAQSTPAPAAAPVEEKKETPAERMRRLRAKQAEQEGEE